MGVSIVRQRSDIKRSLSACALVTGCALLGSGAPFPAEAAPAPKKTTVAPGPVGESEVLRRLQDLEAQVSQYREETRRLRAELDKRPPSVAATSTAVPAKAAGGGEWDEPEVEKKPEGRDEEARRRLLVLETQSRRNAAEVAKQVEAQKDKFKFEFSGKYKARFNSRNNFNLDNPNQKWKYDNATFFDQRYSLQIDASYEALLARLVLDKGNFTTDWKEDSEGTMERWGEFQTLGSQLVRELFLQYTGPFMVRVGRQSWDIGQRIVLEGPMDGLRLRYPLGQLPWGQTSLSAGYMAVAGGWGSYTNFNATGGRLGGNRQEVFGASNKLGAYYADLDIRVSRSLHLQPYVLKVVDGGGSGDADLNLDRDFNATTTPRDGHFQPLWTGISASLELDKWKFDAEAVLLSGDYAADRKLRANALVLKGERDFGKVGALGNLSAGLQFGRGSGLGTSDPDSGTMRNFSALFMCRERNKFGNIFSEDIRAGYYFFDSNLANITYLRLDTTLQPYPGLKITPSVTKLWTTKEVFVGRGPVLDWSQGAATSTATTRDVGWEADLAVSYPLYKHLDGFFSLGYFQPGAVYSLPDGSKPGPAWELVLGAEVKF
jgi:hypothetical protein